MRNTHTFRSSTWRVICLVFVTLFVAAFDCSPAGAGTFVYVANAGSNSVSVIKTANNTVVATIPLASSPAAVAVTPDGTRAYATSGSGSVYLISTITNTVIATIAIKSASG